MATNTNSNTQNKKSATAGVSNGTVLLPVIDIANNMITITNYLSAIQTATLPSSIASNPVYGTLTTEYGNWQFEIWSEYFEGLVDGNIIAQVQDINNLIQDGLTEQSVFINLINPGRVPTPTVISLCDDVTNQITAGNAYLEQLQAIATSIQGVDKAKIAALNQIVTTLSTQFDSLEDQLTDKAIDNMKEVFVTVINVSVAVASEQDPIAPLAKGVAQVGTDIINELMLSSEINETISQLQTAWSELDAETLQLAQINLLINRLNTVLNQTSKTLDALNNIVNDWQLVSNAINDTPANWTSSGLAQVTEWASRMSRITFSGSVVQTISNS
jgi:hypothetical protein